MRRISSVLAVFALFAQSVFAVTVEDQFNKWRGELKGQALQSGFSKEYDTSLYKKDNIFDALTTAKIHPFNGFAKRKATKKEEAAMVKGLMLEGIYTLIFDPTTRGSLDNRLARLFKSVENYVYKNDDYLKKYQLEKSYAYKEIAQQMWYSLYSEKQLFGKNSSPTVIINYAKEKLQKLAAASQKKKSGGIVLQEPAGNMLHLDKLEQWFKEILTEGGVLAIDANHEFAKKFEQDNVSRYAKKLFKGGFSSADSQVELSNITSKAKKNKPTLVIYDGSQEAAEAARLEKQKEIEAEAARMAQQQAAEQAEKKKEADQRQKAADKRKRDAERQKQQEIKRLRKEIEEQEAAMKKQRAQEEAQRKRREAEEKKQREEAEARARKEEAERKRREAEEKKHKKAERARKEEAQRKQLKQKNTNKRKDKSAEPKKAELRTRETITKQLERVKSFLNDELKSKDSLGYDFLSWDYEAEAWLLNHPDHKSASKKEIDYQLKYTAVLSEGRTVHDFLASLLGNDFLEAALAPLEHNKIGDGKDQLLRKLFGLINEDLDKSPSVSILKREDGRKMVEELWGEYKKLLPEYLLILPTSRVRQFNRFWQGIEAGKYVWNAINPNIYAIAKKANLTLDVWAGLKPKDNYRGISDVSDLFYDYIDFITYLGKSKYEYYARNNFTPGHFKRRTELLVAACKLIKNMDDVDIVKDLMQIDFTSLCKPKSKSPEKDINEKFNKLKGIIEGTKDLQKVKKELDTGDYL